MDQHVALSVLVPEETTNYILNPSFRYDTTDWGVQGATLTRTLTQARFHMASGQVVTNGAALHEGIYFRVSALDGINDPVTVSAYVRGNGAVRIRLDDNSVGGGEYPSQAVQLLENRWTRISVTGRSHGGNDMRLYVETDEDSAVVRTFYVDGAQMERKAYATSYCDGDQDGCHWNGIFHASESDRPATTRAGGRWVELSGPNRESENLYMTVVGGLGMAAISNSVQKYALSAGGYHQGIKINMRQITLTFHAKSPGLLRDRPVNLEKLHALRQFLIDVIKPDLTGGDEDIWFEYRDGEVPLYFRARYDGGLDGEWDVRNGWVNSFPLRLLAVNPIIQEDSQEAQVLQFQKVFQENYVLARIDGEWNNMNYGFNKYIYQNSLAFGLRGDLYGTAIDNTLNIVNNNAAAIDPLIPARSVVKWDGEKWSSLGPAIDAGGNAVVRSVAVAPNGYIYVCGDFTSIGGVAANYVAYWDGSAWNAMGAGLNNAGWSIAIAPNGNVYVGGDFTTAGGITAAKIAYWDGGSWHHLGTYAGLNDAVNSMVFNSSGSILYVGGSFTTEYGGGLTLTRVASYDVAGGTFSAMGNGFNGIVYDLVFARNSLYAAGNFSLSGSDSVIGMGLWNGTNWISIGMDLAGAVSAAVFSDGTMVVGAPLVGQNGVRLFNGSTWTRADCVLPFHPVGVIVDRYDNLILSMGPTGSGKAYASAINTVDNPGSHETNPKFFISGPAKLQFIENQTTRRRMYFDLDILNGENIVIDTAAGTIQSQLRSNLLYGLLAGSDLHDFILAPGENRLACFMYNDVNAAMSIQFPVVHWGVDASEEGRA